ncbi:exodeoxyribonuclease III [Chitinilyticum piscinae]|uniref:Exodeoxyribonuclease III n=1 Tax=Chitinilyticum piscinae TaxID=2866724 RepID=A0A8J7FM37_9NEIS|nr:exodeoxyribonuclease III [Chitinilyticum piscinae]MBE9610437.1 exodeoxyribonuclease III [Chitinilyticum piscinae]
MQLATWNVNSLKIRLPQVLDWLTTHPEVTALCLQETKMDDPVFPREAIEAAGFRVAFAGQKTYNGVAIIARDELDEVIVNIPGFPDEQKRVISATIAGVRVVCAYIPNGQALDSDKYQYKLAWLDALSTWLAGEQLRFARLALLGDYNIAPEDRDAHAKWSDPLLVSPPERAAFQRLLDQGFSDVFRQFEQAEKSFSWWDYRGFSFKKNAGLRIDHILATSELASRCRSCVIDVEPRRHERPSDHTPVIASFE